MTPNPMNRAKQAILGLLCGLVVGAVVLGVGGRAVMSVIAFLGHITPAWSFEGSIEVIVFGALVGGGAGLLYGLAEPYLPGRRWLNGLTVGLLLFGMMVLIRPPSARSAMAGYDHLLLPVLLLFGATALAFGIALASAVDLLHKRIRYQQGDR